MGTLRWICTQWTIPELSPLASTSRTERSSAAGAVRVKCAVERGASILRDEQHDQPSALTALRAERSRRPSYESADAAQCDLPTHQLRSRRAATTERSRAPSSRVVRSNPSATFGLSGFAGWFRTGCPLVVRRSSGPTCCRLRSCRSATPALPRCPAVRSARCRTRTNRCRSPRRSTRTRRTHACQG